MPAIPEQKRERFWDNSSPDAEAHGLEHKFSIGRPTMVNSQPAFQYGGYTFLIIDEWPVAWAYTDDCYVDYIDGDYFLFDLLHPGMRIALFVEM